MPRLPYFRISYVTEYLPYRRYGTYLVTIVIFNIPAKLSAIKLGFN